MAETEFDSFNDPALRSAVRRAWAGERAPQELREQIVALCPNLPKIAARPRQPMAMRIRSTLYGLAAAAAFLLAIGVIFHTWDSGNPRRHAHPMASLPPALADILVSRHDVCADAADHHTPGVPQDDFSKMAQVMRQKVGFPVLASALPAWKFQGSSVCQLGNSTAAQLVFERRSRTTQYVSLFSLPLSFAHIEETCDCDYSQVQRKHPMAGFATSNGFYCVVGSSTDESITLTEVRTIRDELRPKMSPPANSPQVAVMSR